MFTNKLLLITGSAGSFGNAIPQRFIDTGLAEIRIFSHDEKKQDDLCKRYGKTIGNSSHSTEVFHSQSIVAGTIFNSID